MPRPSWDRSGITYGDSEDPRKRRSAEGASPCRVPAGTEAGSCAAIPRIRGLRNAVARWRARAAELPYRYVVIIIVKIPRDREDLHGTQRHGAHARERRSKTRLSSTHCNLTRTCARMDPARCRRVPLDPVGCGKGLAKDWAAPACRGRFLSQADQGRVMPRAWPRPRDPRGRRRRAARRASCWRSRGKRSIVARRLRLAREREHRGTCTGTSRLLRSGPTVPRAVIHKSPLAGQQRK